jgi:hypothetical protein
MRSDSHMDQASVSGRGMSTGGRVRRSRGPNGRVPVQLQQEQTEERAQPTQEILQWFPSHTPADHGLQLAWSRLHLPHPRELEPCALSAQTDSKDGEQTHISFYPFLGREPFATFSHDILPRVPTPPGTPNRQTARVDGDCNLSPETTHLLSLYHHHRGLARRVHHHAGYHERPSCPRHLARDRPHPRTAHVLLRQPVSDRLPKLPVRLTRLRVSAVPNKGQAKCEAEAHRLSGGHQRSVLAPAQEQGQAEEKEGDSGLFPLPEGTSHLR